MTFKISSVLPVFLVLVLLSGCSQTPTEKMPITTNSEKALEYYYQARNLTESLHNNEAIEFYEKAIAEDSTFA